MRVAYTADAFNEWSLLGSLQLARPLSRWVPFVRLFIVVLPPFLFLSPERRRLSRSSRRQLADGSADVQRKRNQNCFRQPIGGGVVGQATFADSFRPRYSKQIDFSQGVTSLPPVRQSNTFTAQSVDVRLWISISGIRAFGR